MYLRLQNLSLFWSRSSQGGAAIALARQAGHPLSRPLLEYVGTTWQHSSVQVRPGQEIGYVVCDTSGWRFA